MRAWPLLFAGLLPVAVSQAPAPERAMVLAQLETGKGKGEPSRLAWSDDGTRLYLQTTERDQDGNARAVHSFILDLANPVPVAIDGTPEWATRYWNWKSYKTPPNSEGPEIMVSQRKVTRMATDSAMGGSINEPGGGIGDIASTSGTTVGAVVNRAQQQVKVAAVTLTLKGEVVGQFVGTPPVPGMTFGWAPPSAGGRLAYANTAGHLAILDMHGQKQEIAGTRNVSLPAWSPDGARIAFISVSGKNTYDVCLADAR